MIKGAIFDIDGTLLDTMPMWYHAGNNYLSQFGLRTTKKIDDDLFCMSLPAGAQYIWDSFSLGERGITVEDVRAGIKAPVVEYYHKEARPKPGAKELLISLKEAGLPVTVVTSSDRLDVSAALERLDMLKYVDRVFSCTEVGSPKSEPVIWNMASEFMGLAPEDIWVFEDGLYAIRTAGGMGFRTAGVYDDASKHDWEDIQKETDISGLDLSHITLEKIREHRSEK